MTIGIDSLNYEVLENAARSIRDVSGMTCEIGVRTGGGTKYIIDSLLSNNDNNRTHICIDPYGHIPYLHHEDRLERLDYTNSMRDQCIIDLHSYTMQKAVNLIFFTMGDDEFMKRFADGVPVYEVEKEILTQYALVHMDGPHSAQSIIDEFEFFTSRMVAGAMIVCDDVSDYDHDTAHKHIISNGWETVAITPRKISYRKYS